MIKKLIRIASLIAIIRGLQDQSVLRVVPSLSLSPSLVAV
jgi:hypothetical protein